MKADKLKGENRYDSLIQYYSWLNGLDWLLIKAQIKAESNFNPFAVSHCGANGLAQFMEATWGEWGYGSPFNPEQNIKAQCKYMSWLLKQFDGLMMPTLSAYNWGIGNMKKLLKRVELSHFTNHIPKETQEYIVRIDKFYQQYKEATK